jgi:multicomponent Na+:H+ antiporter subunit G
LGTTLRAAAVIVFLLLTAPVAAHLIGRAAYHRGIHLFDKTWIDELGESIDNANSEPDDRPAQRPDRS